MINENLLEILNADKAARMKVAETAKVSAAIDAKLEQARARFEELYGRKAAEQIEASAKAHQKRFADTEAALCRHSDKATASLRTFSERRKNEWVNEIVSGVIENTH